MLLGKTIAKINRDDFCVPKHALGSTEAKFQALLSQAFTLNSILHAYLLNHPDVESGDRTLKKSWGKILEALKTQDEKKYLEYAGTSIYESRERQDYLKDKYQKIIKNFNEIIKMAEIQYYDHLFVNHALAFEILCLLFEKKYLIIHEVVTEKVYSEKDRKGTKTTDILVREFGVEFLDNESVMGVSVSISVPS